MRRVVLAIAVTALAWLLTACGNPTAIHSGEGGRPTPKTTNPASSASTTTTVPPATTTTSAPDGPLPIPPSLLGTQWSSLPTDQPEVALTFDCGSNDAGIPAILAALQASGATATFTITGVFAETYPQVAKTIAADGYDIADPKCVTQMSLAQAQTEVTGGAQVIETITGRNPSRSSASPMGPPTASWSR